MIHEKKDLLTAIDPEEQVLHGYKKIVMGHHSPENAEQVICESKKNAHIQGMEEEFIFICHRRYRNSLLRKDSFL